VKKIKEEKIIEIKKITPCGDGVNFYPKSPVHIT
jgi:hypothetical protein